MRLVSYIVGEDTRYGAVDENGIVPLSPFFPEWRTLRDVLAFHGIPRLRDLAAKREAELGLDDVTYSIPVPDPGKIICVGINYPARNDEYADKSDAPPYPSLFVRFPGSLVGHGEDIIRPRVSDKFDYEGEVAVVIGRAGRHISESEAHTHIAGATLCNEGSVRDWLRHAKFNVTPGKNFEKSGSMGPWLTLLDDHDQIRDIQLITRVNGEVRQRDRTSRMVYSVGRLLSYISTFTELHPGDVIVTGTPTGAGARLDPPAYLQPGDIVEVAADGLGILRNTVADES